MEHKYNLRYKIPAIFVQVRYSSSRLPGKALMEINGQSMIQRINNRLKQLTSLPIYFLTSDHYTDDIIETHCIKNKINYFRGNLDHVLQRYITAGETLGFNAFFRVTGDNPFVDGHSINKYWKDFMEFDYVDNIHSEGNVIGTGFEFIKLKCLKSIPNTTKVYYREHVTTYLRENMQAFHTLRFIPDNQLINRQIFLTCDYEEDFKLIEIIYKNFRYSNNISAKDIIAFLITRPDLLKINSKLHTTPEY